MVEKSDLMTFPELTKQDILKFQFSSWYPIFSDVSIRSVIIRPLRDDFLQYLASEGVFIPEGSENFPVESTLSDDEDNEEESEDTDTPSFSFPDLDAQIRAAVSDYSAVFPKLNFSSPKDASWVLPAGSPLKCTSPADVYMLLKSSDFISHDITPEMVFDGCIPSSSDSDVAYELELVLRKWYHFETSREFRCFVRQNKLLAISQRDHNFYDFMNDVATQQKITETITKLWTDKIKDKWDVSDYVFDVLVTRDLSRAHIIDFNPYAPRTDSLLFDYDELVPLLRDKSETLPTFRAIDSASHISATRNAPMHQHNMVPIEALTLSEGQSISDFARIWEEEVAKSVIDD